MAYHLEIRQRDENKALVFSKSWSYGEECLGSVKKESKSEKSTHPLKRLKYGIRMERATNEPFCSVLSSTRRNKKSLADVSHTLQIPPPPFPLQFPDLWTDQLNPVQRQSLPSFTELVILQSPGSRTDLSNTTGEKNRMAFWSTNLIWNMKPDQFNSSYQVHPIYKYVKSQKATART